MERIVVERVDFTGAEKDCFDKTLKILEDFRKDLEKELAFPSLSDLFIDTEALIIDMNAYLHRYYKDVVEFEVYHGN